MKFSGTYEGNLEIKRNDKNDYSELTEVTGNLYINSNAKLEASNLQTVGGNLSIHSNTKLEALQTVGGNLSIHSNTKLEALQTVGGNLYINSNAKLETLQTVGGNLYIHSDTKLEALQTVGRNLYINSNAKLEASNLQTVGGNLYIHSDTKLEALQTVGGNLSIHSNTKLEASNLQTVGGNLSIHSDTKLEALQTVGGNLSIHSNTKLEASKNIKYNVANAKEIALKFNFDCFFNLGFLFADGILAKILNRRKNVYKIQIVGKQDSSYCVEVDGVFSHGATIKEAKESLIYKISNRDTSMYKDYTLDTVVTFEEAVKMYRCITGACEQGTKYFCTTRLKRKKSKYTIKEIIELTKNQYGHKTFKEFFEVNNGR